MIKANSYNLKERNGAWKGSDIKYDALHAWINRNKPRSMFCEKCGEVTSKLDCANISGLYKRDISDFRWLCRKCHMIEDGRLERLQESKPKREVKNNLYKCANCKEFKNRNEFGNDKKNRNGVHSLCLKCRKIKRREQYLKSLKEDLKNDI